MQHWLIALRNDLGLDQSGMARKIGVTRGRIGQIETQGGTLSNERVLDVWRQHGRRLRRLGYSLEDLLTARPSGDGDGDGAVA